jgi:hypothetical protein
MSITSAFFSGCPNLETGYLFLFKGLRIGISSYVGVDSATQRAPCITLLLNALSTMRFVYGIPRPFQSHVWEPVSKKLFLS